MRDQQSDPAVAAGLFGKLPSRGDFVRLDLPGDFVAALDAWLQASLADSQGRLGADWRPAWMEAPVWRFAIAPRVCGAQGALGLMLPSVDRVGRCFPLVLAAVAPHPRLSAVLDSAALSWLDACEAAGIAALDDDLTPEAVLHRLPPPPPLATPASGSRWWTQGSPRVAAGGFAVPGLPGPGAFAAMLDDGTTAPPAAAPDAR